MKNLLERKRQDLCSGCGKSIMDSEKECPHCGAFPHKAYHERAAAKALGVAKWVQNAPAMQPNQKLSEEIEKTDSNIIRFCDFIKIEQTQKIHK
jgi:predicted amidophosphoribosyltransferase